MPSLDAMAAEIRGAVPEPTLAQERLLEDLCQQAERLRDSAFQLAVLGQFKRGKSTLLNAIIGEALLSAGVLPLTAVATFLTASPVPRLRLVYESGALEDRPVASVNSMTREIAAATTEEGNPHNAKGLRRVDVGVPGSSWLDDVTLIDTPGIGSTYTHNTDAAYAVLPECDAALFVCSVDPPITEVELAYLDRICRTIPRVIIVLNKADLVDADDLHKAMNFLATIIAERPGAAIDRRVFAVSARQALAARRAGDQAGFEASGLAELERYVRATLIAQKRDVLELSIASKMTEIAAALAGDAAMTTRALSLPIAELDATVLAFEQAVIAFERERIGLEDALNGEWRRSLSRLDALCEDAERRVRRQLDARLDRLGNCDGPDESRSTVTTIMNELFDKEFAEIAKVIDAALTDSLQAHQRSYQALAARVRQTAGTLLDVPVAPALPTDWFQTKRQSYWVGERRAESLGSLTVDGLSRLLPATIRRRRQQRKFREAVGNAVTRNISDLHWTMRQNIDDSFRGLIAAAGEVVETSIDSTRDLLTAARQRRQEQDIPLQDRLERARAAERKLAALHDVLSHRRVASGQ
jgi:GTP-binding protein EngB required for normal cell division